MSKDQRDSDVTLLGALEMMGEDGLLPPEIQAAANRRLLELLTEMYPLPQTTLLDDAVRWVSYRTRRQGLSEREACREAAEKLGLALASVRRKWQRHKKLRVQD